MRKALKYTPERLQEAADNSVSYAGMLRYLGLKQAGGTQAHIRNLSKRYNINTGHFTGQGHQKGKPSNKRLAATEILVENSDKSFRGKRSQLLRALIEVGVPYQCANCFLDPIWNDKPLTLEIDHINGNTWDNRQENLRFLCPNCHSQEDSTNLPHKYRII